MTSIYFLLISLPLILWTSSCAKQSEATNSDITAGEQSQVTLSSEDGNTVVVTKVETSTKDVVIKKYQTLNGKESTRVLMGKKQIEREKAESKELEASPTNKAALDALLAAPEMEATSMQLPPSVNGPFTGINPGKLNLLGSELEHDCETEEGYGVGSDIQSDGSDFRDDGLLKNATFALKNYRTCVKEQGWRGTCSSFAIAGGIETLIAKKYGKFVNLSEQEIYFTGEYKTDGDNEEGLSTYNALKYFKDHSFSPSYERTWYYNPSYYRFFDTYTWVCAGYTENTFWGYSIDGQACSETAHQGKDVGDGTYEGVSAPSGYQIASVTSFYSESNPDESIQTAKSLLRRGYPVLLSFYTTNDWDHDKHGWVNYTTAPDTDKDGGHAVFIVGHVGQGQIPDSVDTDGSDGYFIIKNSWGENAGDQGYYYLSDKFIKKSGYGLYSFDIK